MSKTIEKLKSLNLKEDAIVTLSYSEGTDVFVHNESEVETALENTHVVDAYATLISTPGLDVRTEYGDSPIETLRDSDLLDEYPRDFSGFSEFVAETIRDNFYDVDLVEYTVEKYDYKRGFCTLTASAKTKASDLINAGVNIDEWEVSVNTGVGTLTLG